ncbi:class I SAM-dependent methyltransferase [Saccharopolyspora taberi]|uniref:Class I SAM-dependent methyltransferase n=1 Tax=Saccharopolyspora taberi TaxID=60895 RepID=A0ABN3VMN2_9PSEU
MHSNEVAAHYENLLAEHYTWMFGADFADLVRAQRDLLAGLGIRPEGEPSAALDLGCGSGVHSVALAELGFAVTGVDVSETLLAELADRAHPRVRGVHADLRDGLAGLAEPGTVQVVTCMGDTLPHLPDEDAVRRLLAESFALLAPGGRIVLTFRDLSVRLAGLDRFLPVRGDQDRVMTCFLEDEGEHVRVHDLVHVRTGSGWELRKSSYRKLRLSPGQIAGLLADIGFRVAEPVAAERGMWVVAAQRP